MPSRRLLTVLVAAVALLVAGLLYAEPFTSGTSPLVLGVLEANPTYLRADTAAGIRLATVNLSWASWEPALGSVDRGYERGVEETVDAYRAAGWKVAIDPGLQQPPAWALALPGARLVDQTGGAASTVDFEFSRPAREAAGAYLTGVVRRLGPVEYYRVGLSENGEAHYPDTSRGQWWAYSPAAQGHDRAELPPGVGATPMPGWVPGSPTWRGRRVSRGEVESWYGWYFDAMVGAHAWEIATYRRAGFHGRLELVMPGDGALPEQYRAEMSDDLAAGPDDPYATLNTGAVWWKLLDDLPDLAGAAVDVSSVYDDSGDPRSVLK